MRPGPARSDLTGVGNPITDGFGKGLAVNVASASATRSHTVRGCRAAPEAADPAEVYRAYHEPRPQLRRRRNSGLDRRSAPARA